MNPKIITKLALFVGYLLFAGFSAYFTATSLSLNLLEGKNMWLVFVLVLIVAILAGWCLTNVIAELKNPTNPSKSNLVLSLLGFLIFWAFSFTTNVHFFFVEKHGYSILVTELTSAKNYIIDNTTKNNNAIDEQMHQAQMSISSQIDTNMQEFSRELNNTMEHHEGFGEHCINILKTAESTLQKDSAIYGDKNTYVIFDDVRDSGDKGITTRNRFPGLRQKYITRMQEQLNKKLAVIKDYYERQKDKNTELLELLGPINDLEEKHLPKVEKVGSANAFYKYYRIQDSRVIAKMPTEYNEECVVKSGNKIKEYLTYPSKRMFDTMSVWGDILSGRLKGMSMIQWIIIALIFDIVAFILFALFRKA